MRLNIKSDDFNFEITTIVHKDIYIEDLHEYFHKKFWPKKEINYSIKNLEIFFVFYYIEQNRIFKTTEVIFNLNNQEINIKLLKLFKNNYVTPCPLKCNLKIEETISEITGAKKKLKLEKKLIFKSNRNFANEGNYSNYDYDDLFENSEEFFNSQSSIGLLRNEVEIIQSFVNHFQNIEVDETNLIQLVNMGFEENRSRIALMVSRNNLILAGDVLLNANFENYYTTIRNQRSVSIFNLIFEY
jgi:hypothetical protein